MYDEIMEELTIELSDDETFNEDILSVKVKSAIREVKHRRNYTATSYTDDEIEADLENYYSVIKSLALYDYNQRGAEYESGHSENSVSRTWIDRDDLLKSVHSFVAII